MEIHFLLLSSIWTDTLALHDLTKSKLTTILQLENWIASVPPSPACCYWILCYPINPTWIDPWKASECEHGSYTGSSNYNYMFNLSSSSLLAWHTWVTSGRAPGMAYPCYNIALYTILVWFLRKCTVNRALCDQIHWIINKCFRKFTFILTLFCWFTFILTLFCWFRQNLKAENKFFWAYDSVNQVANLPNEVKEIAVHQQFISSSSAVQAVRGATCIWTVLHGVRWSSDCHVKLLAGAPLLTTQNNLLF